MIKGIDIGYSYTKDESENLFKSAYTTQNQVLNGGNQLEINGTTYYVGIGNGTVDLDKTETMLNKLCLLNCLAMSNSNEYFVVTGLPINQYATQKDKLRDYLLKERRYYLKLNGIQKSFTINDVIVFPQATASIFTLGIQDDAIIVDIGSRTVDIAYMVWCGNRFKMEKFSTLHKGMFVLHSSLIQDVNKKFDLDLDTSQAERILKKGLTIYGETQDVSFLQTTLQNHFEPIFKELRLNYPIATTNIYLVGGGATMFCNAFKKRFQNVKLVKDGQFSNAKGFYQVGVANFQKYEKVGGNLKWANI